MLLLSKFSDSWSFFDNLSFYLIACPPPRGNFELVLLSWYLNLAVSNTTTCLFGIQSSYIQTQLPKGLLPGAKLSPFALSINKNGSASPLISSALVSSHHLEVPFAGSKFYHIFILILPHSIQPSRKRLSSRLFVKPLNRPRASPHKHFGRLRSLPVAFVTLKKELKDITSNHQYELK